jgi:hypothetical protein
MDQEFEYTYTVRGCIRLAAISAEAEEAESLAARQERLRQVLLRNPSLLRGLLIAAVIEDETEGRSAAEYRGMVSAQGDSMDALKKAVELMGAVDVAFFRHAENSGVLAENLSELVQALEVEAHSVVVEVRDL